MLCSNCNAKLRKNAKFCHICGTAVEVGASEKKSQEPNLTSDSDEVDDDYMISELVSSEGLAIYEKYKNKKLDIDNLGEVIERLKLGKELFSIINFGEDRADRYEEAIHLMEYNLRSYREYNKSARIQKIIFFVCLALVVLGFSICAVLGGATDALTIIVVFAGVLAFISGAILGVKSRSARDYLHCLRMSVTGLERNFENERKKNNSSRINVKSGTKKQETVFLSIIEDYKAEMQQLKETASDIREAFSPLLSVCQGLLSSRLNDSESISDLLNIIEEHRARTFEDALNVYISDCNEQERLEIEKERAEEEIAAQRRMAQAAEEQVRIAQQQYQAMKKR